MAHGFWMSLVGMEMYRVYIVIHHGLFHSIPTSLGL